jgi:uncharacterized protein (TIGR03663 family)
MRADYRAWIFTGIVVLASALRLPTLNLRPMHADEAVHAAKLGQLLERGRYEYDPIEYHGPTLNYLTLLPARLRGITRYADLDEVTLRIVPAAAGVLLVAGHALLVPVIGFPAAAAAALLAAVSPAMVYYSRYYIQEMLLVAFSFGALLSICRFVQKPRLTWAFGAGASFGLMYATKETWVIAFASMLAAAGLMWTFERRRAPAERWSTRGHGTYLAAAALTALAVSGLFFSSFLSHPRGVVDSVLAYRSYVERAAGASWHFHPWHYYFDLLLYSHTTGAPIWSESLIAALAVAGAVAGLTHAGPAGSDRRLLGFIGLYTLLMTAAYASIPYKTPWCLLGFLHGLVLLAGVGAVRLFTLARDARVRRVVAACLVAGVAHLGWQAWAGSFRFAADPRNPYVYAHTGTGVFEVAKRVEGLALAHPERQRMPIEVISSGNLWPLPWYLRRFPDVRWETSPVRGAGCAPVILGTPDMEGAIVQKLYEWRPPGERELYVPIFDTAVELRPQVEVRGYAAKSLWDAYQQPGTALPPGASAVR